MPKLERGLDGKIIHTELGSEEAAAMSRARWAKEKTESFESLLVQAGYPDPSQAPEHLQVLARMATSHRSGAVSAMNAFLKLTGQLGNENEGGGLKADGIHPCPCCGCPAPLYHPKTRDAILELILPQFDTFERDTDPDAPIFVDDEGEPILDN